MNRYSDLFFYCPLLFHFLHLALIIKLKHSYVEIEEHEPLSCFWRQPAAVRGADIATNTEHALAFN